MPSAETNSDGGEAALRVLVIDDEPDVLLLCRVNLEFAGHEVVEASDAEQGLEVATRGSFDVVVLDLMLPSRDGISVLRELAEHPVTAGIPVVLLTAKTRADDRLLGWEAGCDAYVTKPFAPADLARTIERVHASSPDERRRLRQEAIAELRLRVSGPASGSSGRRFERDG